MLGKTLVRLYYSVKVAYRNLSVASLRCTTELETVYCKGTVHHKILVLKDKQDLMHNLNVFKSNFTCVFNDLFSDF